MLRTVMLYVLLPSTRHASDIVGMMQGTELGLNVAPPNLPALTSCFVCSMRSGDIESSLEPPASAFGTGSQRRTVPIMQLQHLLGMAQSNRPPMVQSGFSSAVMPGV